VPFQAQVEDRGDINFQGKHGNPTVDDQIVLTALLGFPYRNGWRVSISMTGPNSFHRSHDELHRPRLLGQDDWIYCTLSAKLARSGQYAIKVTSDAVWPAQTYVARYVLTVVDRD
jgi:hypothetical protein